MANPGAALQAILFDHDGTLINSEAVHFKLWQQTLAPFDVDLTDAYYNETMAGVPTSQNGVDVVRDFNLAVEPAALANTKTASSFRKRRGKKSIKGHRQGPVRFVAFLVP